MKSYQKMSREELLQEKASLEKAYEECTKSGLKLDMSRGKPSAAQLELSMDMMDVLDSKAALMAEDGTDLRNYGTLDGIGEAKELMASMIGCNADNIIVYGNSSLNIMYDTVSRSMTHGVMGSEPWCKLDKVKFLCPVPGYDRHFAVTEHFGIEMVNVPMTASGPDMDIVEKLVSEDKSIKGIWCVPKYSNPQGYSYSDETVKRFAALKPAAEDFRIYWDNAYVVHHLYEEQDKVLDILEECAKAGNPDMVYEFCSTSKITFAGSGVAAMAASAANIADVKKQLTVSTIGFDKINQLRHVKYFKDGNGIAAHMKKHAELLRPKFDLLIHMFHEQLDGLEIGTWTEPKGGYFITFESMEGCAKAIVDKAKAAGMTMTPAGAPYPYGKDEKDTTIRIAPSYPTLEDLEKAAQLFIICVKLVSIEKLL